jgi:hypothetical protein
MKAKADRQKADGADTDACGTSGELSGLLDGIAVRFEILRDELRDYVALELDRFRAGARRFAVGAILGLSAALAVVAFVVTSVFFIIQGLAGWLGEATGRSWLGSLLAGVIGVAFCVTGLLVARA